MIGSPTDVKTPHIEKWSKVLGAKEDALRKVLNKRFVRIILITTITRPDIALVRSVNNHLFGFNGQPLEKNDIERKIINRCGLRSFYLRMA